MALSKEFGVDLQKWDLETVDGLAEAAFACAKGAGMTPYIVVQDDYGTRLFESQLIEDVERFLQEG